MTEYIDKNKALICVEHNNKHFVPERHAEEYFKFRKLKKIPGTKFVRFFNTNKELYDHLEKGVTLGN
jgi:hypothetical protein